jgi:hypothetical protein
MKENNMKFPSKKLRILCGFLAAIVLFTGVVCQQPVTVEASTSPYYIKINRQQNCVTIYEKDEKGEYTVPVKAMACSVGLNNATPLGTFTMSSKYRWHELMGGVQGQYCCRINGGVLFHSVYYSAQDPSKLYYNAYNKLGTAASHGCVRLNVADAKWIYDNCPSGTKITIYDSKDPGPLGKPSTIKIDTSSPNRGWDPTDPNPNNPWKKTKPVFSGLKSFTVERGSKTPNLKKGVTATDYKGKSLSFKVSGKCNTKKAGKYKITYTAKDSSGNETTKTITITVKDTKKPKVKVLKKTLTYNKAISEKKLIKQLKANVKATDSGEKLAAKYITVKAKKLINAMSKKKYGTYQVTVYAKDKAGNKSKKVTFKVRYVNPNPQTTKPTTSTNPTTPTDTTNPTEPTQPTDPTDTTDTTNPTDPTDATNPTDTTNTTVTK